MYNIYIITSYVVYGVPTLYVTATGNFELPEGREIQNFSGIQRAKKAAKKKRLLKIPFHLLKFVLIYNSFFFFFKQKSNLYTVYLILRDL